MPSDTYFALGKPDEKKEITVKPALADIIFEEKAAYNEKEKRFYTFDASLRALRKRGYERHPRPAEALRLICNGLEGRLQPEQQAVADDMFSSWGEWLSMAMLREGNLLHCYLDPENLLWDEKAWKYVVQGRKLKHAGEEIYSVGSLRWWVPIKDVNEMNPALVEKLWSRHYAVLPKEIKHKAYLFIPPANVLWPVGLGSCINKYNITTYSYGGSRGVRQR